MSSITELLAVEIKCALARARSDVIEVKKVLAHAELCVSSLEKAVDCNHDFDAIVSGGQSNMDKCKRCGWEHWY